MAESEEKAVCGHCGSENVYGISRVVGYYSRINNWNKSKQAEFKDRQQGSYKIAGEFATIKASCGCDQ